MGLCVCRPRRYALFLFVRVISLCLNAEGAPPRRRLMAKEFATTRKTPLLARSTPRQVAPRTRYFLRTGVAWVIKKPRLYALFFSVRANFFTPKFCGSAAVPRAPPPKKSATSQHTTQHTATETCAEANAPQSLTPYSPRRPFTFERGASGLWHVCVSSSAGPGGRLFY